MILFLIKNRRKTTRVCVSKSLFSKSLKPLGVATNKHICQLPLKELFVRLQKYRITDWDCIMYLTFPSSSFVCRKQHSSRNGWTPAWWPKCKSHHCLSISSWFWYFKQLTKAFKTLLVLYLFNIIAKSTK